MELFLLYLITRLTDLKDALHSISIVAGIGLVLVILARILNEVLLEAEHKGKPESEAKTNGDVYFYYGTRRVTKRGLKIFTPIFVIAFVLNMFLPTTRDAIVISGGYGLVEAVKNERVQRLFSKSASVASQWFEAQLNGEEDEEKKAESSEEKKAEASEKKAEEKESSAEPAEKTAEAEPKKS